MFNSILPKQNEGVIFITGHAIDRASQRLLKQWRATRNEGEGLYSWLLRRGITALREGTDKNGKLLHAGILFGFTIEDGNMVLRTVMADDKARYKEEKKRKKRLPRDAEDA